MKLKVKPKKLAPKPAPDMEVEEVDFEEAPALACVAPPKNRVTKKPERRIYTLAEIPDDAVYGLYSYNNTSFGCSFKPALGSEIRKMREKSFEYGVIKYYPPNTRGITETGTFHLAPKNAFLIRLAEDYFAAAIIWLDAYTPEEEKRAFHFQALSRREQRVLSIRTKKRALAEAKKLAAKAKKPAKKKFAFKRK
jgi:hypothetical protein